MDPFNDNKIEDKEYFSDITENDMPEEDPEETEAVNVMVKNIAGGENAYGYDDDGDDEEEWVVHDSKLLKKIFAEKEKKPKSEKPKTEKTKAEKTKADRPATEKAGPKKPSGNTSIRLDSKEYAKTKTPGAYKRAKKFKSGISRNFMFGRKKRKNANEPDLKAEFDTVLDYDFDLEKEDAGEVSGTDGFFNSPNMKEVEHEYDFKAEEEALKNLERQLDFTFVDASSDTFKETSTEVFKEAVMEPIEDGALKPAEELPEEPVNEAVNTHSEEIPVGAAEENTAVSEVVSANEALDGVKESVEEEPAEEPVYEEKETEIKEENIGFEEKAEKVSAWDEDGEERDPFLDVFSVFLEKFDDEPKDEENKKKSLTPMVEAENKMNGDFEKDLQTEDNAGSSDNDEIISEISENVDFLDDALKEDEYGQEADDLDIEAIQAEKEKEAARIAEEKERKNKELREMQTAVEDLMYEYGGETEEEREERHKKALEMSALPVIDLNEINFFDDNKGNGDPAAENIEGINENLAMFVNDEIGPKKKKKWPFIVGGVVGFLLLFALFILFTRPGHTIASKVVARIIFSHVEKIDEANNSHRLNENEALQNDPMGEFVHTPTPAPSPEPTLPLEDGTTPVPTDTPTPTPTAQVVTHPHYDPDPSVINILLIGIENYDGTAVYGRSDSMMIASIDKDGGPLVLVSLMRDMYVEIPGYNDNRLNAAYFFGGPELLMETIELNFGVKFDGYAIVDYSGFENIIDYMGGLEVVLTSQEAEYLNTTNYISDKTQRNVIAGSQVMTGNQVVGYCRIRHVPSSNGLYNDFGRTYRQRLVMNKIFEKFKDSSVTTLYGVMKECLKYVKCPASLESITAECIQTVVEKRMFKLESYRIPVSGHYEEVRINNALVLGYYADNADILHDYLYNRNGTSASSQ